MDASVTCKKITERLGSFLGLSMVDLDSHVTDGVSLKWKIAESWTDEGRRISVSDTPQSDNTCWLSELLEHAKIEVSWARTTGHQLDAEFSFRPTDNCFYYRTGLKQIVLIWNQDFLAITPESIDLGSRHFSEFTQTTFQQNRSGATWTWSILDNAFKGNPGSLYERYGSSEVLLTFRIRSITTANMLCHDLLEIVEAGGAVDPTDREQDVIKHVRKQFELRSRCPELITVKRRGSQTGVRVLKSVLAAHSPELAQFFQSSEWTESKSNCYEISDTTDAAIEKFVLYCEIQLLDDMEGDAIDLIKLAHQYEVHSLVRLCELRLILEVCRLGDECPDKIWLRFPTFLDICRVASLLELPLLLVLLHFMMINVERLVVHLPQWSEWRKFLDDTPDFRKNTVKAIKDIRNKCSKKRKLVVEEQDEALPV